jgi:hypothetical protein
MELRNTENTEFNLLNHGPRDMPFIKWVFDNFIHSIKYINLFISIIILIVMLVALHEAKLELTDASATLSDVNFLVPQVRESLNILEEICKAPQYKSFCGN